MPPLHTMHPMFEKASSNAKASSNSLCYQVRDGFSDSVWNDPWILNFPPLYNPTPLNNKLIQDHSLLVKDLILKNAALSNITQIHHPFSPQSVETILKLHHPSSPFPDKLTWSPSKTINFSVFFFLAYNIIHTPAPNNLLTTNDWKKN